MRSILNTFTTRLLPALLTAAGVVLVTAGLLSFVNPPAAGIAPTDAEVVETLAPSIALATPTPEPTDASPPVSPSASASVAPSPSASVEPTATAGADR